MAETAETSDVSGGFRTNWVILWDTMGLNTKSWSSMTWMIWGYPHDWMRNLYLICLMPSALPAFVECNHPQKNMGPP